jgi:hypothetical protein
MPTWKIQSYRFYFKVSDLIENKPAHIHIETSKGEIEFWLEPTDTKMSNEIRIKKIKGNVSDKEQNDTKRIVQENKDLFLKRWNEQKIKIK